MAGISNQHAWLHATWQTMSEAIGQQSHPADISWPQRRATAGAGAEGEHRAASSLQRRHPSLCIALHARRVQGDGCWPSHALAWNLDCHACLHAAASSAVPPTCMVVLTRMRLWPGAVHHAKLHAAKYTSESATADNLLQINSVNLQGH